MCPYLYLPQTKINFFTMDIELKLKTALGPLRQAQAQGLLTVFVGAGVSRYSNSKYPSWKDIIDGFVADLNLSESGDFQKTAQLFKLEFGEYTMYQQLQKFFPEIDCPTEVHETIFKISPQNIITTNWDSLLEKQNEKETVMFDVIACDKELVMSQRSRKLIKMHGDFTHHNIVFTEDDYLNYSNRFPLIENFLKSIFSTQTVLLLGYSFNDTDLKQIITWVDSRSQVRPPIYMAIRDEDISHSEERYLGEYGITLLRFKTYDEIYSGFLKEKFNQHVFPETLEEFVRFLRPLTELNTINRQMICTLLRECMITYEGGRAILTIFNRIVSQNKDVSVRDKLLGLYEEIKTTVEKTPENILIAELDGIFSKAQIWGIATDGSDGVVGRSEKQLEEGLSLYDFSLKCRHSKKSSSPSALLEDANVDFSLGRYREASVKVERAIKMCNAEKNFLWLLIAKFNWNVLRGVQIFRNISLVQGQYHLQEDYLRFPDAAKPYAKLLLDFLDFSAVYREVYRSSKDLKTIESSTFINPTFISPNVSHKHFIDFTLSNFIFFEHYDECKSIHRNYIEIAVKEGRRSGSVSLERFQLFACIRYLSKKDIQKIFADFFEVKKDRRRFEISEKDRAWILTTVLPNIQEGLHGWVSDGMTSKYESYFSNALQLLSISSLKKSEVTQILAFIKGVVEREKVTFVIFEAFNSFLEGQLKRDCTNFKGENLIEIVELLLQRVMIYGNSPCVEEIGLPLAYPLWSATSLCGHKFNDEKLIAQVLNWVNLKSNWARASFVVRVVLTIYQYSTPTVKREIKTFCRNLDKKLKKSVDEDEEQERFLVWRVRLLFGAILQKKYIPETEIVLFKVLKKYEKGNCISSGLGEIWYLIQEMGGSTSGFSEEVMLRFKRIFEKKES